MKFIFTKFVNKACNYEALIFYSFIKDILALLPSAFRIHIITYTVGLKL
jgi:hypothetical protein